MLKLPKRIVVVCSGESGDTCSLRKQVVSKIPEPLFTLTPKGIKQSGAAGEFLRDWQKKNGTFDQRYVSTFVSAKETAEYMFPKTSFVEDSRIDEWQGGNLSLLNDLKEIIEQKFRESVYYSRAFGRENGQDVDLRIHSILNSLRDVDNYQSVLMVSHPRVILFLKRIFEGLSVEKLLKMLNDPKQIPKHGSVYVFRRFGRSKLELKDVVVPWELELTN